MAGWKLSTLLFAGTTLFLLCRDLLRPEPPATRAQPRPEPVVAAPLAPPEDAEPPPPPEPPPSELPAAADELAYAVLVYGPQRTWEERLALLEPRRDEVVPVLEDWIAREEEIYAAGASLKDALSAYARLKGKEAVPVLERLAVDQEHKQAGMDAVEALTGVEDPDATQAILRLQALQPPGSIVVSEYALLGKTKAAADVVRAWEAVPAFRPYARRALFIKGTPEERERIWQSADREERRYLLWSIGYAWIAWDTSIIETATQFLQSGDPRDRDAALGVILRHPEAFPPATVAAAERTLAADFVAAPRDMRKSLEHIKSDWDARRKASEKQERIRAVLLR